MTLPDVAIEHEIEALLDREGRVLRVSDRTRELLGMAEDELLGESGFDTIHPADLRRAEAAFAMALRHPGETQDVRVLARPHHGPWRVLELEVTLRPEGLAVQGRDATDRRRQTVAAHLESTLLERLPVGIVVTDESHVVAHWNERAVELFGWDTHEAIGCDAADLANGGSSEQFRGVGAELGAGGRWEGEYDMRRKDGSCLPVLLSVERMEIPEIDFAGYITVAMDNTERRALRDTLAHQALHDPLTGLPNRALFIDRVDQAMARLHRAPGLLAVLFVDLDRFKLVNDTCGHQAGDEILRAVGQLFAGVVRPEDTVARLGGDEFAICCDLVDGPEAAVAVAERLTAAVSQPFVVDGREFYVSPSIGITLGRGGPGESASTLLRDADAAMYCAKERGRGRIELFDQGMRDDVLRRAEVASQLRHALGRDELRLHYQPVIRLADGELTGFEALVRWEHPERGLLPPGEFLDVAEDTNLIVPIGAWALGEAARQLAAWRDALPERPMQMSVNLSARQIADATFVPTVRQVLERHELDGSMLCLEITESILMEDADASVATLRELKALGVELAIDDFGTGYSSLTYLKRFPVDYLKIDRSFVHAVDRETEDAVIVRAVLELGRALGLTVIAEGVETADQLAELRRLGCELAQGFHWSRPVPADEALALARVWVCAPVRRSAPARVPDEPALLSTAEVLSVLTHELVTPLTVVKGQCERLAILVADDPLVAAVVDAVSRNAERIEQLVDTLADAQQLEAGAITLRPAVFDLVELVRDVAPMVLPAERQVVIVGAAPVELEAEGRRVEQVLVNLLTNAHKFSPPGRPILVTVTGTEHDVELVVADEGAGVPPERVADIFRKFARLERSKKGVGLGLFISRRLARAHGGDLHHRRRPTGGSEFVLTLPRRAVGS